jgi:hypothetical protein
MANQDDCVVEIRLERRHEEDGAHGGVVYRRRREVWRRPLQCWIDNVLLDEAGHLARNVPEVHAVAIGGDDGDDELLLARVCDKVRSKNLRTRVHKEVELA